MADINVGRIRTAATTDDDGLDHIGADTPRSGVATPQPDLHDKRLPGIMSYFSQVRPASFKRLLPSSFNVAGQSVTASLSATTPGEEPGQDGVEPRASAPSNAPLPHSPFSGHSPPLLPHEMDGLARPKSPRGGAFVVPYPTPPSSERSSQGAKASDFGTVEATCLTPNSSTVNGAASVNALASSRPSRHQKSSSDIPSRMRHNTSLAAPLTGVVTESTARASHFSNSGGRAATTPNTPVRSRSPAFNGDASSVEPSRALHHLRTLTNAFALKSGQTTPTRALSTAKPSQIDSPDVTTRENGEAQDRAPAQAATPPGAQAPAPKGKLTIKIAEARGLRKSRDPYVVVVFQRSELISGGPRPAEDEDDAAVTTVAMGGVPIQRQASDSGRPPMAIPMRSRQSSNTSITDHTIFRKGNHRRSFTNPTWDAEALFDVVDSDMLVDISVYNRGQQGEEFLGHVDFRADLSESHDRIRGWFALKGHADTMAENAPTGEIYVEAYYQRTDRRHFGPEDFQILRLIGKGTFGQVYQVRKKDTKRIYAMKVLSKKVIVQKKEVAHTVGERNILVRTATSDSPFIVGLKFSFQTPSDLYLVTDYMSGGELFWHLQKEGRFDEKRAKFYIAELILAIQHLHNNDIVYRDLKPENILLDANGHIALCDFGLSKANLTKNDTTNTFCGTTEYLAPEVLLDEAGYTKMVDFWSLGVLVFEMCCGWSPFYAEDTQQMYKNIAFGKVRFPRDTLSNEGRNFVKGLLNRNPKHRLGATDDAEELKRHPFFNDTDWDALSRKLITPPFKPQLKSETDVSYFDPEFTNALNTNGSLNERALQLSKGYGASTPLSPSVQANFQGFTFVDESALDEHMKDKFNHEDEEMDDVHQQGDNEWDDLADIDPRHEHRMSGVVKSNTNDEQMFGSPQFEM